MFGAEICTSWTFFIYLFFMLQQRPFNPTLENVPISSHPLAPAQILVVLAHTWREER